MVSQIEAILNSRSITAISLDPLIRQPLTTIVERNLQELKTVQLSRWQIVSARQPLFWDRWSKEYLHRRKWQAPQPSITTNSLVLIEEDNFPPQKWLIGRVVDEGSDTKVRVAVI